MGAASRYWRLVRLDATGKRRVEEVDSGQAFFQQQFLEMVSETDLTDASIQRQLLDLLSYASNASSGDGTSHLMAERCLRCFISSQIEQVCIQLEAKFGNEHGFTRYDLFPFVLDDVGEARSQRSAGRGNPRSYQSFATEILRTFDPERSSLATWTSRLVKHHREVNTFLLDHGVYMVSDWAILNNITPSQLQRIFASFHNLTPSEIQHASILLESYHAVYRRDRLKQRKTGIKRQCLPPTIDQLQQIAQLLNQTANRTFSPEAIMTKLQNTAERLRQYRIYARGGTAATKSINEPETQSAVDRLQSSSINDLDDQDEQTEFLTFYGQQFINCLDQALEQVTSDRFSHLQRKDPHKASQFITALQLFHCQGQSMGEIASLVNLQDQFQVSRLLKLKEFRADVRQQMLQALRGLILEQAKAYTRQLSVQDGAEVTVSSPQGQAGNLTAIADSVFLDQGNLTAVTGKGQGEGGANITLQVQDLLRMHNESQISADAFATANGGNINIDTDLLIALPPVGPNGSDIKANAFQGNGGRLNITAQGIFGISFQPSETPLNDITASSDFGSAGVATLNTPDVDPSRGLVNLPTDIVDASGLIAQSCPRGGTAKASEQSEFIVTGRGGLPPNPGDTLSSEAVLADWATLDTKVGNRSGAQETATKPTRENAPTQIVEAQGWAIGSKGEVILIASAPTVNSYSAPLSPTSCRN